MGQTRKRLLYFNSAGRHDVRLLSRLRRIKDSWHVLYVTLSPILAKQMQDLGIEVRLLLEEGRGYDDWNRPAGYGPITKWRLKNNFQYYRKKYRQVLQEFKPDLVHSGWIQTDGYMAALEKNCPLIVMALGTDAMVRPHDNRANLKKTAWVMKQADLLNGDSIAVEQAIDRIIGKSSIPKLILPKGIDLGVFHADGRQQSGDRKRMIMVKYHGRVSRFDTLFEALTPMRKNPLNLQLNIFGDGPQLAWAKREAIQTGVYEWVGVHGRIDNKKLPDIYRATDFFISCNESEGTSYAMMEAFATGILPIVTALPAYTAFIRHGENGFVFAVGDSAGLADCIKQAVELPASKAEEMRQKNIEFAKEHFDADKSFDSLVQWYEKLTG
jgi:glycosyltransferase involved in cell wall biosynthesis